MASEKCVVLKERPGLNDAPTAEMFEANECNERSELQDEQVLVKTLYLSVDPYMRCRMRPETGVDYIGPWQIGNPCDGPGVGVVLSSKFSALQKNDIVYSFGWPWKTIAKMQGSTLQKVAKIILSSEQFCNFEIIWFLVLPGFICISTA